MYLLGYFHLERPVFLLENRVHKRTKHRKVHAKLSFIESYTGLSSKIYPNFDKEEICQPCLNPRHVFKYIKKNAILYNVNNVHSFHPRMGNLLLLTANKMQIFSEFANFQFCCANFPQEI